MCTSWISRCTYNWRLRGSGEMGMENVHKDIKNIEKKVFLNVAVKGSPS